jgi:tetratricopeptide (TPR) repeat protein
MRALTAADWIADGTYAREAGKLRLRLSVLDATTSETLAHVAADGDMQGLLDLVARAVEGLRTQLGLPSFDPAKLASAHAASAQTTDAQRTYAQGLMLMHAFDLKAARESFLRAVELAPDYPLAHSELANVYQMMGKDDLARKESARALSTAQNLSREAQLVLEARAHAAALEWGRAAETWETLFRFDPENLDYGIQLARCILRDGRPTEAFAVIARLRQLPEPASRWPAIDLLEAAVSSTVANFTRTRELAKIALQKGEAIGARSVIADASNSLCVAELRLGDAAAALRHQLRARQLYLELGDQSGLARSLEALGRIYETAGDYDRAVEVQQDVLAIARGWGEQKRIGSALLALGSAQSNSGDLAAARRSFEAARDTFQALGSRDSLGYAVYRLGLLRFDEGALSDARALVEGALEIHVAVGAPRPEAWERIELGMLDHAAGNLEAARERIAHGRKVAEAVQDRDSIARARLALGIVARDTGDINAAVVEMNAALNIYRQLDSVNGRIIAELDLADLAIDRAAFTDAEQRAGQAFAAAERFPVERAYAAAIRMRAIGALGRASEAQQQAQLVASLLEPLQGWQDRIELRLALAEQQARAGDRAGAAAKVKQMLSEAQHNGHVGFEFEARALLVRLAPNDKLARRQLQADASARGYARIVRLLDRAL